MGVGRIWESERFSYLDPRSGREVIRFTNYRGHSNHLYFTEPCWIADGKEFIFTSDRENKSNLFRCNISSGLITQLTDLKGTGRPTGTFSQANMAHYFWYGGVLYELDIKTLNLRPLFKPPEGFVSGYCSSPTADGRYVCTFLMEAAAAQTKKAISWSYSRFEELFEMRPLTRIVAVEVSTGKAHTIHQDRRYIGHINASPRQANLITFCHEGPWARIDQRIWGANLFTGEVWPIRLQQGDVSLGHEYWFADGVHIGYHGRPRKGAGKAFFGKIRWDNKEQVEFDFPYHSTHFHSNDLDMVVGDGTNAFGGRPFIQLFKREGDGFVGPRLLAFHRSTFNDQHAHPHPRFSPDGKHVMYSSDLTGYSNIYWVAVGDFYDLPELP